MAAEQIRPCYNTTAAVSRLTSMAMDPTLRRSTSRRLQETSFKGTSGLGQPIRRNTASCRYTCRSISRSISAFNIIAFVHFPPVALAGPLTENVHNQHFIKYNITNIYQDRFATHPGHARSESRQLADPK